MGSSGNRNIFFFIFALSGFSGLIYESIWTHYLKLFLGHAAYAQTLVLAIFMGGMAIGAWLCSRYSTRWKNIFLIYALAEAIIGLSAILFHPLYLSFIDISFTEIVPALDNIALVNIYKWSAAAFIILPQSILLGMTFPLMSAGIIRRFPDTPGHSVSFLYFTNSIGGALGVLTSGFLLIKWIGLPGTILFAGSINILLSLVMWSLCKNMTLAPLKPSTFQNNTAQKNNKIFITLLSIAVVTGSASFIYEIGWIRMLSLVLGSSTHAFELMLSAFILGLALGGLWIKKRIDTFHNPVSTLAWIQIIMGLSASATLLLYGNSFGLMQWFLQNIEKNNTGYFLFNFASQSIAIAIMLPATFCAGMTLPLLTFSLIKQGYGEKSIGLIYSANTIGAIIGILFAVHIGFQFLGLKGLIIFGSVLDILAGIVLLWWFTDYKSINIPAVTSVASLVLVISIFMFAEFDSLKMASGVYRNYGVLDNTTNQILAHQDGKTASVDLTGQRGGLISIRTNGKTDAAINMASDNKFLDDEVTMVMIPAIPLLIKPDAKHIANIGLGSGLTSHVALQSDNVMQVDTIEIEQAIVNIAKGFLPRNKAVYNDPRSNIYIEDAKTFFSSNNKQYDIILSEPSNPWVSGVSGLFSREFYNLIGQHLNKEGLFVQWVQLYEIDVDLVMSIFKAIAVGFDYFDIYIVNRADMIIIAKNNSPIPPLDPLLFKQQSFAAELKRVGINNIQDILIRKAGNKQILMPYINSFPIDTNSDYYPVLDQYAARSRFLGKKSTGLNFLSKEPLPILELLAVVEFQQKTTNSTLNNKFKLSHKIVNAQLIRDNLQNYFLNNSQNDRQNKNLKNKGFQNTIKTAQNLNSLLLECKRPPRGDKVYALLGGALQIIPYLKPAELNTIWHRFESASCLKLWNNRELLWFSFLKAIGNRDKTKMADISSVLLKSETNLSKFKEKYLVASNMIANIALGKKRLVYNMMEKYKKKLFVNNESDLLFKFLATHSKP